MNPLQVEVRIEVARFGFVKRTPEGAIDLISPLPCPFNYGSVPGTTAGDGDPVDAVVLGARRPAGTLCVLPVRTVVDFWDAGHEDPKLIVADRPLSAGDRWQVTQFFTWYAFLKRGVNTARGLRGETAFRGYKAVEELASVLPRPARAGAGDEVAARRSESGDG